MTIEQERLTPTQPITRAKLIEIMRETFTEERPDGHYNLLVLGCQEANYCDPEDAEHATLILAADAMLAALKSPPIGGEGDTQRDVDEEEAYQLGVIDGESAAVQMIDMLTGGDGEYRFCTDHDPERHCPDVATMRARIVERFNSPKPTTPGDVGKLCEELQRFARWSLDDVGDDDSLCVQARNARKMIEAATLLTQMEARTAALEKALEPFAAFAQNNTDGEGWAGLCCQGERIRDWFGPSDFRTARALLNPTPTEER